MKNISSLLLLICGVACGASTSDWLLIQDKKQIAIYSQQQQNHKLKHFKAETEIHQDADTILAALQDTAACTDWVYNCISNKMVGMSDVRERVYHTIIKSPLWFKDRDFYLQSQVVYKPENKSFTIELKPKPNHAKPNEGMVRVSEIEMVWHLEHVADNITAVTYQVYIDPKLPIKALNHKMIEKSIFETMLGLTELVKIPKYAETKYTKSELEMLSEQ